MSDWFQRYVVHNFGLKLIALIAAVLLWAAISHEPKVEIAYSVPIEFHQVPENLEITSETIPQAQVRLRGPVRRLRDISPADVHPVIDLSGSGAGERTYDLTAAQVHVPYDVEVVQVVPSQVRISFDRQASREVKVRPRVQGALPSGYSIAQIIAEPASIQIVGPERRVSAVDAAMTDPIDASGVVGRGTFTTNAYVADPLVRELRPEMIRVTVITEKTAPAPGVVSAPQQ